MSKNNIFNSSSYFTASIGILATIIGIISFIPVAYLVYKTKKTNNFPYSTLILALIANLLWFIYGIYEPASANILAGSLYFIIYLFIFYIKLLY